MQTARPAPPSEDAVARGVARYALIGIGLLALLAVGLWARYGSVVFLETMANAWAYCF